MCKVTKDGYILKTGKIIKYDTDISDIDVKDINDLNNETSTKWDNFILHREVQDISNNMSDNFNKLMQAIESSKLTYINNCPLNVNGIVSLVEEKVIELANNGLGSIILSRVDAHLKKKNIKVYQGFKGFLRDFILIATSVTVGVGLFKLLGG